MLIVNDDVEDVESRSRWWRKM